MHCGNKHLNRLLSSFFIFFGCSSSTSSDTRAQSSLLSTLYCDLSPPIPNADQPNTTYTIPAGTSCLNEEYIIQIDRRFLCDQEPDQVQEAWESWAAILGDRMKYSLQYPIQIENTFEACKIKVMRREPNSGIGGTVAFFEDDQKTNTALISLTPTLSGRLLFLATEHEMGHSLGLPHVPNDPKDIMAATTDQPFLQVITCKDKIALCKIWGCVPEGC